MPPDRGSVLKSQKTDVKKESKLSTSRRDKKPGDTSSKTKVDVKASRDPSLPRLRTKVKNEEAATIPPTEKASKSSRIDVAKLKDVKKDLDRDLKNAKEIMNRNRTVRNSVTKPAATRAGISEKTSSDRSLNKRTSNDSLGAKKVPTVPSNSKRVQQTSSIKSRTSNLTNEASSSPKSKPLRSVHKQRTFDRASKDDQPSHTKPSNEKQSSRLKQLSSEKHSSRDKQPKKLSRERTRTRTLSPHEVKMAKSNAAFEIQSTSKASVSTREPAAKAPSRSVRAKAHESGQDDQALGDQSTDGVPDDYEDDFEDYESDFEEDVPETSDETSSASELTSENEDTSVDDGNASGEEIVEILNRPVVEEEKKLDSGNYDLTESKRKGREMQKIKEALEKENADVSTQRTKTNILEVPLPVAQDEGFEEYKADAVKAPQPLKNAVIINFANAKRKMEEQKVSAKARKRGEELLSMVRMDVVNFSLLDLPPVPYDVYIKSYGRSNNQQVAVQTNEDDLSEETQTEEILAQNKWTQYPVAYPSSVSKGENLSPFMLSQAHLGCGGDTEGDPELWKTQMKFDAVRLNKFLLTAAQAIVQFLDEQSDVQEKNFTSNPSASFFSSGYFNLNANSVPCIAGRSISQLYFSEIRPTTILTVHQQMNNVPETEAFNGKCILCVWNILRPDSPEKILMCANEVSSACFHPNADHLVFGGLCEGTVCVWDLQEPSADHFLGKSVTENWIIRSPTYSTAEILKNNGHLTEVSAISAIKISVPDSQSVESNFAPIQICSVEVAGLAIIWTVIQNLSSAVKSGLNLQDLGIAFWGKVQLVRSIVINIFEGLDFWICSCFMYRKPC